MQVTYPVQIPKAERTKEVEVRLQELLDLVGVGYLVTRWAGDAPPPTATAVPSSDGASKQSESALKQQVSKNDEFRI